MARFPQPEVTDLGDATPSKLRAAGFDMGPGNPNVGAGGSPQAQAFRAQQQPFVGPPPPASPRGVPPPANGMGYNTAAPAFQAGQAAAAKVGDVAKAAGPALQRAGARVAQGVVNNSNPILNGIAQTAGHGDIYFDDKVPLLDRIRVGATDALGVVGGTVGGLFGAGAGSIVTPVAGTVAGGLAGGIGGMKAGNWAGNKIFGSDEVLRRNGYDPERGLVDVALDGLNGKGMFGGEQAKFNRAITAPGAGPQGQLTPVEGPAQPAVTTAGLISPDMRAARLQQAANALGNGATNTSGLMSRQGNSFSGKNIREGFAYEDGPGSRPSTGSMSVLPSGPGGFGPNASLGGLDAQLAAARSAAADRGDFSSVGGGATGPTLGGFGGGTISSDLRAKTDAAGPSIRDLTRMGMSVRQAQAAVTADADRAERARAMDVNAATQRYGTDVGANVSIRGQDVGANTAMRGQDMTLAANRASNRLAVAQAQRDQFNKDRDYAAGRSDQGFKERDQREQALQRNIEAAAPIDPATGKPDANYVRDTRAAFDRSAARMGVEGPHAFSPRVEQQLLAANGLLKQMREHAGPIPYWHPDKLKTIDPVDLTDLRVLPNGDRQITRKDKDSKAMGQVIPSRFFDTEGANRIRMFGTPTNRYDILSGQGGGQ